MGSKIPGVISKKEGLFIFLFLDSFVIIQLYFCKGVIFMLAYGKNVLMMSNPAKIKKVYLSKTRKDQELITFLKENKIHYVLTENSVLSKMVQGNHQGIVFEMNDFEYHDLKSVYQDSFVVVLDHLEDPHNFGAIIRTCEAAGVKAIIIPKDRSVHVNETVLKTSVGCADYVKIVLVSNIADAISKLQENGFFVYGTDMNGEDIRTLDFPLKKAVVIGNEGKGISKVVEKKCDVILSIPMLGEVNSLNASVAAGIVIFKMGGLS